MKLTAALALITSLGLGASGSVIRAYEELGCHGDSKWINVWDNTCRNTNVPKTKSVRFLWEGGWHQRACIYAEPFCALGWEDMTFWVDGGSVQVGECIDFHGFTAKSFGSWFAGSPGG